MNATFTADIRLPTSVDTLLLDFSASDLDVLYRVVRSKGVRKLTSFRLVDRPTVSVSKA